MEITICCSREEAIPGTREVQLEGSQRKKEDGERWRKIDGKRKMAKDRDPQKGNLQWSKIEGLRAILNMARIPFAKVPFFWLRDIRH